MTYLLLACYCGLQLSFIWARFTVFRIEGTTPDGVRVIEVATLASIAAGVVLILSRGQSYAALDFLALVLAGSSTAMFAWALRSVKRRQLSAAFSTDAPVELLRSGAFRCVRNPFYLAYVLAHAVPLFASLSPWALLPLVGMAALYRHAALLEERKFLDSRLADEYRRYAAETGRFVPRFANWRQS